MEDKILIIDHEPDIRRMLRSILTEDGYQVQTASCCDEAVRMFSRQRPGLVIMETRLGAQTGQTLIRQFKKMDADVEVIVLTGNASLDNAVGAMRGNGAYDFLLKPLENIDQLLHSIRQALARQRINRERSRLLGYVENLDAGHIVV